MLKSDKIDEELCEINNHSFYRKLNINLLENDECDGDEQALPARDCFNVDILVVNCLWSWAFCIAAWLIFFV